MMTIFLGEEDEKISEDNWQDYLSALSEKEGVKAVMGQLERCPSSMTLHIQGYLKLKRSQRLSWLKRLDSSAHWEKRLGNDQQAIEYCSKEDTRVDGPVFFGDWVTKQGSRNDLLKVKEMIDQGRTDQEVAEECFGSFIRYHKAFNYYRLIKMPKRYWPMEVYVFWGKSGTGKTRKVYDNEDSIYTLPCASNGIPWFDGYCGEECLLIDDFYGWIKISFLLKLMDRYPMSVQVKGSMVPFVSKKIYFTSNKDICDWYNWDQIGHEVKTAFMRRITSKTHFN